jgi:hypothetical protein
MISAVIFSRPTIIASASRIIFFNSGLGAPNTVITSQLALDNISIGSSENLAKVGVV